MANVYWVGRTSGDMDDPTNWDGGVCPVLGDSAIFDTNAQTALYGPIKGTCHAAATIANWGMELVYHRASVDPSIKV